MGLSHRAAALSAAFLFVIVAGAASALELVLFSDPEWRAARELVGGYEVRSPRGIVAVIDAAQREELEARGIRPSLLEENEDPELRWYVVDLQGRGLHSASLAHLRPAAPGTYPEGYGRPAFEDGAVAVVLIPRESAEALHELGYEYFEVRDRADRTPILARAPEGLGLTAGDPVDPTPLLAALDPIRRKLDHEYLVNLQTRHYKQEGGKKAALFVKQAFEEMGLTAEYHAFSYGGVEVANAVGTLAGTDPDAPQVLVTSHMDSILLWGSQAKAPGADDNASGTTAMLAIARAATRFRFKNTLKFIAFHAEEVGLIGSKAYADMAAARGDAIAAVLQMDMLGYGSDKMEIVGDEPSSELVARIKTVGQPVTALEIIPSIKPDFWYSDHSSFWRKGYRAVLVTEDLAEFNPHIHTKNDTFEKISATRIDQSLRAVAAVAADLAGLEGPRVP